MGGVVRYDTLTTAPTSIGNFGEGSAADYYGQTFTAQSTNLSSVAVRVNHDPNVGTDGVDFQILVTTVTITGGQVQPGTVLYESATQTVAAGSAMTEVSVSPGLSNLVIGQQYAVIIDAYVANDGANGGGAVASTNTDSAETFFYKDVGGSTASRSTNLASDWLEWATGNDLALRLVDPLIVDLDGDGV